MCIYVLVYTKKGEELSMLIKHSHISHQWWNTKLILLLTHWLNICFLKCNLSLDMTFRILLPILCSPACFSWPKCWRDTTILRLNTSQTTSTCSTWSMRIKLNILKHASCWVISSSDPNSLLILLRARQPRFLVTWSFFGFAYMAVCKSMCVCTWFSIRGPPPLFSLFPPNSSPTKLKVSLQSLTTKSGRTET